MRKKQTINIAKYHRDYLDDRYKDEGEREKARLAIQKEHIARVKQGKGAWNAWAEQVEDAIQEKINASEEEELAIRNAYKIDFSGIRGEGKGLGGHFKSFKFPIGVDFSGTTFSAAASFSFAPFSAAASFSFATFSAETYFLDTTFSGWAYFGFVTFSGEADFRGARFSDHTNFSGSQFSQDANFIDARFIGGAGQEIAFQTAEFKARCLFSDIHFGNEALAYPVNFLETRFAEPPLVDNFPSDWKRFKEATKDKRNEIAQDLKKKQKELEEQKAKWVGDGCPFEVMSDEELEATADKKRKDFYKTSEGQFRQLKKLAEGNNHHLKATEFYACELYSHYRASGGGRKWSNGANFIYQFFSGYGLSFLKPFRGWLIIMALALVGQVSIDLLKGTDKKSEFFSAERVMFYIGPSFSPINHIDTKYPSEVRKRLYPANPAKNRAEGQMPALVRIFRFIQSVFSLVMFFLMALALRNRFKIG